MILPGNDRIQLFNCEGVFQQTYGSTGSTPGRFKEPTSLVINNEGQVLVLDKCNHRVQRFDPQSENFHFIGEFGKCGSDVGQLEYPTGLTLDSKGNILIADCNNHRICTFKQTGEWIGSFGEGGDTMGLLEYPLGVGVDVSDNIYVSENAHHRISIFDPTGRRIVVDPGNSRIQFFTKEGAFLMSIGAAEGTQGGGKFKIQEMLLLIEREELLWLI